MSMTHAADRFWSKVEQSDGCWRWTGALTRGGYGRIKINGRVYYAHRVAYELHLGHLPDDAVVCHHCDNPQCVRPSHLFLGTQADNLRDMFAKGRDRQADARGESNNNAKLTKSDVDQIRALKADGHKTSALAERFAVTRYTIHRVTRPA